MKKIALGLQTPLKRSEAILGTHLLFSEEIVSEIRPLASHFAIFCDEQVATLLGQKWTAHLQEAGLSASLFTFPPGEQHKNRETKAKLEDALLAQKFNADSCFIALGGGVTTDLIGFLAATFCRGVPLINIPTTFLGMVDAAIGGKTAVNTPLGKNLIGAFYPADRIYIDPLVLDTLPSFEWTNGCAEVIKYALTCSLPLFHSLKKWNPTDPVYLENIIHECLMIKAQIVEADFTETSGLRRVLNFGHTIGHAIEWAENYQIPHGEAVAMGILAESHMSMKMKLISEEIYTDIESLIRSFPFELQLSSGMTLEKIHSALSQDKKALKSTPRFVLLEKIGACSPFLGAYCSEVPQQILEEALAWMIALFSSEGL